MDLVRRRLYRPPKRAILGGSASLILIAASCLASTVVHLRVPTATGPHAVGKSAAVLTDASRGEPATRDPADHRQLRVVAWYPVESGGTPAPYLDDLDRIRDGLVASGSVNGLVVAALGFVASGATVGAAASPGRHPVVVLSPGNATNVEFYSALATELASHGYVVIGIDHPYQVGAVLLPEGQVATYAGDPPLAEAEAVRQRRVEARTADVAFVLDRLASDGLGIAALAGRLDLAHVGVMGHSDGGITAVEVCGDPRVDACLNIDGQAAGGPFSVRPTPVPAPKPFMYLTKESDLHPALAAIFEEAGTGAFRVVVPAASHNAFTDGEAFGPRLVPTANRADEVMVVARGFSVAFFDHVLRNAPSTVLSRVNAPTDVQVFVYPLARVVRG